MSHKRDGNFQLACARHFEAAHPGASSLGGAVNLDGVGNHPDAWFSSSVSYRNTKSGKAGGGVTTTTGGGTNAVKAEGAGI